MSIVNASAQRAIKEYPIVELDNIAITNTQLVGNIHWIEQNQPFTITANAPLPDAELMVMVERVVDGTIPVDDKRFKAVISGGVITINGIFSEAGNYTATATRINRGLERIGAEFRLSFDTIEFDVYVN